MAAPGAPSEILSQRWFHTSSTTSCILVWAAAVASRVHNSTALCGALELKDGVGWGGRQAVSSLNLLVASVGWIFPRYQINESDHRLVDPCWPRSRHELRPNAANSASQLLSRRETTTRIT